MLVEDETMQPLKPLRELLEPDPTNVVLAPVTLEGIYLTFESIRTNETVPEDVRNHVESLKNLAVFGWFHYPFYTLAVFLATTALEMALRVRFPKEGIDQRGFDALLNEARRAGLVRDETLPSSERWHAQSGDMFPETSEAGGGSVQPHQNSYAEYAWQTMKRFRNKFVHTEQNSILTPWMAAEFMSLTVEMINALFADTRSKTC